MLLSWIKKYARLELINCSVLSGVEPAVQVTDRLLPSQEL